MIHPLFIASIVSSLLSSPCLAQERGRIEDGSRLQTDERITVVLTDADRRLEEHGPSRMFDYIADFSGTLYLWAKSGELDTFLQVEDDAGDLVAFNDNGGGGTAACLKVGVEPGEKLKVRVAAADAGGKGALELKLVAAPETEATRDAGRRGRTLLRRLPSLLRSGEVEEARTLLADMASELVSLPGSDRSEIVNNLLWQAGSHAEKVEALDTAVIVMARVVDHRSRTLPEDHPDLLAAMQNYGTKLNAKGDYLGARELHRKLIQARERTLPEEHATLLDARQNLALVEIYLGNYEEARKTFQHVLDILERTLPRRHMPIVGARVNLGMAMGGLGDLETARVLYESAIEEGERTLPKNHRYLLNAKGNLASLLGKLGELERDREIMESLLKIEEQSFPDNHPHLLGRKTNYASTLFMLGDLEGARAIHEAVLEAAEGSLPVHNDTVLACRIAYAQVLMALGEPEGAREILEQVLESCKGNWPEHHPITLRAKEHFAEALSELGRAEEARRILASVIEAYDRKYKFGHPDAFTLRLNLAATMRKQGDFAAARELGKEVLEALERILPRDNHDLLDARGNLARTLAEQGDLEEARDLLPAQVDGMLARLRSGLGASPRQSRALSASENRRLAECLFLGSAGESDDGMSRRLFTLLETRRHVATAALTGDIARSGDPEIDELRNRAARARRALNERVRSGPGEEGTAEEWRSSITRLALDRDRAAAAFISALKEESIFVDEIDPRLLARVLPRDGAAVGFLRYDRWALEESSGRISQGKDSVLAMVLRPDGTVHRVELGPVEALSSRVRAWRRALGKPVERGSIQKDELSEDAERIAGTDLRRALLDPVLEAARLPEEGGTLHVCPDDLLHLVPLDALPLDDGSRVGDRYLVRNEISFARLLEPRHPSGAKPSILLVGDVDFDAEPGGEDLLPRRYAQAPLKMASRGEDWCFWPPLSGTRGEVEAISDLFEQRTGNEPQMLTRGRASKAALSGAVANQRYVHLATHGWFTPESVPSLADYRPGESMAERLEDTVRGFAPMTLCGLCLAGANQGEDEAARVPGLLTAEELASLDLSSCELAVLSACETNVGVMRAGQGIQSLQSALHAAGARAAVTSLWKVPDDLTRELMIAFYTNLWQKGMGKTEALWKAKRKMRDLGHPLSAWAGWVLTGDPD